MTQLSAQACIEKPLEIAQLEEWLLLLLDLLCKPEQLIARVATLPGSPQHLSGRPPRDVQTLGLVLRWLASNPQVWERLSLPNKRPITSAGLGGCSSTLAVRGGGACVEDIVWRIVLQGLLTASRPAERARMEAAMGQLSGASGSDGFTEQSLAAMTDQQQQAFRALELLQNEREVSAGRLCVIDMHRWHKYPTGGAEHSAAHRSVNKLNTLDVSQVHCECPEFTESDVEKCVEQYGKLKQQQHALSKQSYRQMIELAGDAAGCLDRLVDTHDDDWISVTAWTIFVHQFVNGNPLELCWKAMCSSGSLTVLQAVQRAGLDMQQATAGCEGHPITRSEFMQQQIAGQRTKTDQTRQFELLHSALRLKGKTATISNTDKSLAPEGSAAAVSSYNQPNTGMNNSFDSAGSSW